MIRHALILLASMGTLLLTACGDTDRPVALRSEPTAAFRVALQIPDSLSQRVTQVRYSVTASDMDSLAGVLVFDADGVGRAVVDDIPAGTARTVTLTGFRSATSF